MIRSLTILINSLRGGGAEKISTILANQFAKNSYNINFIVLNLDNAIYQEHLDKNINLINLNIRHARYSFLRLYSYLKKMKPERILVFNHELAVAIVIIRMILNADFKIISRNISTLTEKVKNEKSIWHKYFKTLLIKTFYNKVNRIVAQSAMMRLDLIENYKIKEDKVFIINNPVDVDKRNDLLEYFTKENEILYVGRLEKEKGLFYLLDAFSLVLKNKKLLKLRFVGQGSLQRELDNYSRELQINESVIFTGFSKNIDYYYKKANLTVLTSLYEGFPNVLVESIAFGTPVVAFDCSSGPAEIIQNGINGYLVKYLNKDDLKEKILLALDTDWDYFALKKSVDKYRLDNIFPQYEKIITF